MAEVERVGLVREKIDRGSRTLGGNATPSNSGTSLVHTYWVFEPGSAVARTGEHFGIGYRFDGTHKGRPVHHQVVWHFPEPGVASCKTGDLRRTLSYEKVCRAGELCLTSFRLDCAGEAVAGDWTVEVVSESRSLFTQKIVVLHDASGR